MGCQSQNLPDFERLYQRPDYPGLLAAEKHTQVPSVVIVPGVLGSRLVDSRSGREIWPVSNSKLLFSSYDELFLKIDPADLSPLDDHLIADGITEVAAGQDFYRRLIQTLTRYGRYQMVSPGIGDRTPGKRYAYVFSYDWPKDNYQSARKLKRFLDAVRRDFANPSLKVDVIGHSMGGLITRYFARFGDEDVLNDNRLEVTWAGAPYLRHVVLLGTPNLGSVSALNAMVTGRR